LTILNDFLDLSKLSPDAFSGKTDFDIRDLVDDAVQLTPVRKMSFDRGSNDSR